MFKGRTDDVVKLYDLTSLCTTGEFETDAQQTQGETRTNLSEKDDKNPFTVPVAMLLYKVAKNMKNSSKKIEAKQAGSIKELLVNCIKLLPEETHPQIVTSSYFLLADLHIPTGIDPISPEEMIDSGSSYDEETSNSDDSLSTSVEDEHLPPALTESIEERCLSALQYIKLGLNCLKYFSINEAKERRKVDKQAEKIQIIQEEQNPNMAKRYQAIPLPYEQKLFTTENTEASQQLQSQSPVIQTWNVHLKLLLIEKTCTVFAILVEKAYQQAKYGSALKFIFLALKCYHIVAKQVNNFLSIGSNYRTNLLSRAGDCFFQCAQNFSEIDCYIDQYDQYCDIELSIIQELDKESLDLPFQRPTKNLEQLILISIANYESALEYADGNKSHCELLGRIGSVRNELGRCFVIIISIVTIYSLDFLNESC